MSEQINDAFAAFAAKTRQDQEQKNFGSNNSYSKNKEYEEVKWVGLKPNAWKILRFVGNPPESLTPGYKSAATDAVELYFSEIKDDNGKRMQLKLPVQGDLPEKDHVMWRIIRKVLETTWENKQRVHKWENNPNTSEIYSIVAHGGWNPTTEINQFKFSKGWSGQRVCVMNVIDREDLAWHKENKHTKLLSRQVTEGVNKEGQTVYYNSVGVPSYGFVDNLGGIVANYGDWNSYDIGIKRTGQKNSPYTIVNATAYKNGGLKDIPEESLKFVSSGPLTEEEKSWKRYEVGKLYGPTSYSVLKNRLGRTIKAIDNVFSTKFYDEICESAAKEAEAAKEAAAKAVEEAEANKEVDNSDLDAIYAAPAQPKLEESTTNSTPVRQPAAPVDTIAANEKLSPEKLAVLKGYTHLTDEQKSQIVDVELDTDGNITNIKYSTSEQVVACPQCKAPGLMAHTHCLACGMKFD